MRLRILRLFWKRKALMVALVLLALPATLASTLKLSGSCSGCAMSKITLQRGVEQTLKHYVPEVNDCRGR